MLLFIECFIGIIKYVDTVSNRPLPLRAELAMLEANLAKNKFDKITCCLLFESCKKMLSSESCKDEWVFNLYYSFLVYKVWRYQQGQHNLLSPSTHDLWLWPGSLGHFRKNQWEPSAAIAEIIHWIFWEFV